MRKFFDLSFRATWSHWAFWTVTAAICAVSLSLYAVVAGGRRFRHSRLADRLRPRPRVQVDSKIAWAPLDADDDRVVVDEVASVVDELGYNVVVVPRRRLQEPPTERDVLRVSGIAEKNGVVLKIASIFNEVRVRSLFRQATEPRSFEAGADVAGSLIPWSRYFPNQFVEAEPDLQLALPAGGDGRDRVAQVRTVLRSVLAVALFFEEHPEARRLFDELLEGGSLLGATRNDVLARVFRTTGYYFAVEAQALEPALRALERATTFAPDDVETNVMKAYVLVRMGEPARARAVAERIRADGADRALVAELRVECEMAADGHARALALVEEALELERDDSLRWRLHAMAALLHGMRAGDDRERAGEMIKHLEDVTQIQDDIPLICALQGFAWALYGDTDASTRAFERAEALAPGDPAVAYWRGKALSFAGNAEEVVRRLQAHAPTPEASDDASLLRMIGKNLRRLPGRAEEALRYVDRAIELDETDEDAFVTRAIASLNVHGWPEAANELPPGVNERARKDLLRAVRLGSKDAPAHFLLALLYQADGDPVNAVRYGERARELDPDDLDYALFVAQLLEPDAPAKAVPIYEQVRRGRPDDGDAATGLALALQRCGDWARARDAYRDALALDPDSADLHNNFAFALWETGDIEGSLAEWAAALAAVPELADAHAGRAIALEKQGDGDGALAAYRRATELDASYLDLDKLVAEFLWSPAARATIEPVRARLVAAGASQQV